VKVSSEIPPWNKYTMRSYASRQNVCDVPYSRGQWVPVLLGLRCALISTIFPRSTGTDRIWVFVNLTYVPTRHERPVWIMISIHCSTISNYFLHGFFTRRKVLNVCGLADFVHEKIIQWYDVFQGTGPCCSQLFPRNSFQEAADELFVHSRRWLVFNNVAVTLRPAHPPTSTCVTILSSDFQVYRLQFYSLQSLQQFDDWMIRYDDPVFLPPWWFCFVHFAECIALHARIGFHDGWWLQFLVLWIGNRVDAVSQWMIFWSMMSIQSNYKHNY
jgi:hypothetical protein